MAKFQPLAGKTYTVIFVYDTPRHNDKTDQYSESWSYGVKVDGSEDMLYWNVYSPRVKATIDSMGTILKGIPIQVTVAQEMGESNKPHNTYHFVKDNVSYYSQVTQPAAPQAQPAQQPKPQTQQSQTTSSAEELDKRKRLMKWCIETVCDIVHWPESPNDSGVKFSEIVPLIQSLHVEIRDKGIYPPEPLSEEEIDKSIKNNPLPEAQDIHGQPPPGDEDLPF